MKASDISDEAMLGAIRASSAFWRMKVAMLDNVVAVLAGRDERTGYEGPTWVDLPRKIVLAKVRSLIRRGVIGGCPCGCRGDFEVIGAMTRHPR